MKAKDLQTWKYRTNTFKRRLKSKVGARTAREQETSVKISVLLIWRNSIPGCKRHKPGDFSRSCCCWFFRNQKEWEKCLKPGDRQMTVSERSWIVTWRGLGATSHQFIVKPDTGESWDFVWNICRLHSDYHNQQIELLMLPIRITQKTELRVQICVSLTCRKRL